MTSISTSSALQLVLRAVFTAVAIMAVLALASLPARESLYRDIAGTASASPLLSALVGAVASRGLLLLVALAMLIAVWSWLRDRFVFWRFASAGVGVVGVYVFSEVLKLMVAEQRPCHALDLTTVLPCPDVGDWSWPSNHSVLAAAFATACILAAPRTAWFAVPVAALIAYSRVAAGVHYVHDVTSGLALGTAVVILVALALQPAVRRLPTLLTSTKHAVQGPGSGPRSKTWMRRA